MPFGSWFNGGAVGIRLRRTPPPSPSEKSHNFFCAGWAPLTHGRKAGVTPGAGPMMVNRTVDYGKAEPPG